MVKHVKFLKRSLNYIRLYLNKCKNGIFMAITHEQGVLTRVLWLDSLELIFGSIFMNFGAIDN
jgi:hypothetical protein